MKVILIFCFVISLSFGYDYPANYNVLSEAIVHDCTIDMPEEVRVPKIIARECALLIGLLFYQILCLSTNV